MSSSGISEKHTSTFLSDSNLDTWVSRWEQKDIENELHITCTGFVSPEFILQKINAKEPSKEQKDYIRKVKTYLQSIEMGFFDLFPDKTMAITRDPEGKALPLKDVLEDIFIKANEDLDRFIKYGIGRFLNAFENLKNTCEEYWLHDGNTPLYEETFTRFISELALLCCLTPVCRLANGEESQSVWNNFRGFERAVSQPDIRFMKFGILEGAEKYDRTTKPPLLVSVVSVVEVRLSRNISKKDPSNIPKGDPIEKSLIKRKPSCSSQSVTTESTSSDNASMDHNPPRYRRKRVKSNEAPDFPFVPIFNSHKVLGQHAGELLLDLHNNIKETDCQILRMPGLIIDGIKVIFTLLEMQYEHLRKLRENKELDPEDKAVLYFSTPHDILRRSERNMVFEYFMQLNNMVGYGHKDTVNKTVEEESSDTYNR